MKKLIEKHWKHVFKITLSSIGLSATIAGVFIMLNSHNIVLSWGIAGYGFCLTLLGLLVDGE